MQKYAEIVNLDRPDLPHIRARICESFMSRLRGLMFQRTLNPNEGILLAQKTESIIDATIHMLFMQFDLSVVWISSNFEVVDIKYAKPWRIAYSPSKPAQYILELPADQLNYFNVGDRIVIDE